MQGRARWVAGLVAVAVFAAAGRAEARCAASHVTTMPEDGASDVPTNGRIVVTLSDHQPIDRVWDRPGPGFRLVPDRGAAIRAVVVEEHAGGDGVRPQITLVLAPERDLAPHSRYRLEGPTVTARGVRLAFRTGAGSDTTAPALTSVAVGSFEAAELGCGPSEQIPVTITATDDRAGRYARFRLAHSDADRAARRFAFDVIVPIEDGVATLGHGMCWGNHPLDAGDVLFAEITVLDAAFQESGPRHARIEAR